jgi:DNA-binding IclR family transcriptional regulator
VLLAFLPAAEREALLESLDPRPMTPATLTDLGELRAQLDEVARRGTAFSAGERVTGAVGVSAPVFDAGGSVVAALSVLGPESRIDDAKLREFEKSVRSTAEAITERMRVR